MERNDKRSKQKTARIELVDSYIASPEERAKWIYDAIPEGYKGQPWTILCFCVQYISGTIESFPWMIPFARKLNSFLYTAHYYTPIGLGLIPPIHSDKVPDIYEEPV